MLKGRGLHGVDIVVSDSHSGLVNALQAPFQGSTWQRCQTHFMRNFLDAVPKHLQVELYGKVRAILDAPDVDTARLLLKQVVDEYGEKASKAVNILESAFDDVTAASVLPERYRKRLRTTNGQERLNEEIRRRDRVIRIYPNRDSAIRLIGALLMEMDEKWQTGHRYFDMAEYYAWREEQQKKAKEKPDMREKLVDITHLPMRSEFTPHYGLDPKRTQRLDTSIFLERGRLLWRIMTSFFRITKRIRINLRGIVY
ncbi:hypothetical protein CULT_1810007 [[Clostridium] ultunense Esp]|nr:hypothetical protein CULT_1810007 [[Clostridium] ultunense Esp]